MTNANQTSAVIPFPKAEQRKPSSIEQIWGKEVLRHGFTGVPCILIRGQRRLGINTTQMNIILQLLEYWVDPARKPFPTKKDIANRIGVTDKTVQTNIRELEKAGLVRRETRRTAAGDYNSNIYHLDGLIERVKKLEPEFAAEKEKKARAKRDVETPTGLRNRSP